MLKEKIEALKSKSDRLSSGLQKLIDTKEKVSALEDDLKEKTVVVEEKKAAADEFAQRVGEEKAKVTAESEKANLEAQTCAEIQKNVSEQRVKKPPTTHSLLWHLGDHSDRHTNTYTYVSLYIDIELSWYVNT